MAKDYSTDEEEKEELDRAIAMSLDSSYTNSGLYFEPEGTHYDLPSDAKPSGGFQKVYSKNHRSSLSIQKEPLPMSSSNKSHTPHNANKILTGDLTGDNPTFISTLDRKAMEQSRLARLKRKASISPPPPRQKRVSVKEDAFLHHDGTSYKGFNSTRSEREAEDNHSRSEEKEHSILAGSLGRSQQSSNFHRRGVVKKTWAYGHSRDEDVKIEEVLQKNDLEMAVLSSFQWDMGWLMSKLDLSKTQLVFIMQAKDEATKYDYRRDTASITNLRLCFPPMTGNVTCMHSKLQLLFHPTYLRVVVPSANLVPHDWGETGIMENVVFFIDLPLKSSLSEQTSKLSLPRFGQDLIYFLEASGLQEDVVDKVVNYDFSLTEDVAFVHSVGGSHSGETWRRTGYCGLGRAIENLGLRYDGQLDIDFVASSIGSIDERFLKSIYLAAQGDDGLTEYNWRNSQMATSSRQRSRNGSRSSSNETEASLMAAVQTGMRIYFPTEETVANSSGGRAAGGTIFLQSRWYNAPSFPRQLFRDCRSRRAGLLMHNKMIFVRPRAPLVQSDVSSTSVWAYVGSANASESAWGRLVKDRTTKAPRLNCRNWECGVVLKVPLPTRTDASLNVPIKMEVFRNHIPVPMEYPGRIYESKLPWIQAGTDT